MAHWANMGPTWGPSYCMIPRDNYERTPMSYRIPARERRELAERYGGRYGMRTAVACEFCNAPGWITWMRMRDRPEFEGLATNLVIPAKAGGAFMASNCVLACKSCYTSRKGQTVEEWRADLGANRAAFIVDSAPSPPPETLDAAGAASVAAQMAALGPAVPDYQTESSTL